MTTPTRTIPWARLVVEGFTIVVSILLAFAIDAWWDGRTQDRLVAEQIAQLRVQMQANSEAMDSASVRAQRAATALVTLGRLVGPEPELVSADSVAEVIYQSFRVGPTPLQTNALRTVLSSGQFALSDDEELHQQLIVFESRAEYLTASEGLFCEIRLLFTDYLSQIFPMGMVGGRITGERTDFDAPVSRLLTDMRVEGLAGELGIRAINITGRLTELRAAADSILVLTAP